MIRVRLVQERALFPVELEEAILENALPDLAHELVVKVEIVLPEELPAEVLAGLREVMQIGARVARARRAVALRVERARRRICKRRAAIAGSRAR